MNKKTIITGAFACALIGSMTAQAATINWRTAKTVGGEPDVSLSGISKYAYSFGSADVTLNTQLFTGEVNTAGNTNVTLATMYKSLDGTFGSTEPIFSTLSTGYQSLLASATYGRNVSSFTATLNGLAIDQWYEVQVWANDSRAYNGRSLTLDGAVTLDYNNTEALGGIGQYSIGTFKADAASQVINVASSTTQINALQLREIDILTTSAPNILVVVTDQQFADVMSCVGTPGVSTPAMDSIAANGVRFTEAYVTYPVCSPHRYAMYTGRLPCHRRTVVDKPTISLGNQARTAGYDTAYFGKWHLSDAWEREDIDYHGFEICEGGRDIDMTDELVAYLNEDKPNPFLIAVNYYNPHDICEWGRKKAGFTESIDMRNGDVDINPPLADCPELPLNYEINVDEADAPEVRRTQEEDGVPQAQMLAMDFTKDDWRQYRWAYHRMVELVDLQLARVLQALEDNGLADNTVIIFTSDHGDGYAAHRWHQKGVLYEESVRVPFLISYPGNARKNETDDHLISIGNDLIATISDIVGVEMPSGPYYGKSAMPFVFDANTNAPTHEYVVTEAEVKEGVTYYGRSVRTADFKYHMWDIGGYREQLFDMVNDRGETTNLANNPAYADELQRHRELLFADWLVKTDDLFGQVDSDRDGLSDEEEKTMSFSDPEKKDSDDDGLTDYEEWLVGSDPMFYSSPFVMPSGIQSNKAYRIEWPSLERRIYTLVRTDSLVTPDWKEVYRGAGTGGNLFYQDTSGTNGFYRLQVQDLIERPEIPVNIALNQTASASSVFSSTYAASKAFDGDIDTRWASTELTPWLEVDFGSPVTVNGVRIVEMRNRISSYEIQVYNGSWETAFVGGNPIDYQEEFFPAVMGSKFRFQILSATDNPTIEEVDLYAISE